MQDFTEDALFSYNEKRKIWHGVLMIAGITLALSMIGVYYAFLRTINIPFITSLEQVISHVTTNVADATLLGIIYTSGFGGLFFLSVPLELLYLRFLQYHSIVIVSALFIGGITLSYTANYLIGSRLTELSKRLVGPKRFYVIKGHINRHGAIAVYALNVLPLTSQPASALLGVFKYNKTRFYVYMLAGQITKYAVLAGLFMLSAKLNIPFIAGETT